MKIKTVIFLLSYVLLSCTVAAQTTSPHTNLTTVLNQISDKVIVQSQPYQKCIPQKHADRRRYRDCIATGSEGHELHVQEDEGQYVLHLQTSGEESAGKTGRKETGSAQEGRTEAGYGASAHCRNTNLRQHRANSYL